MEISLDWSLISSEEDFYSSVLNKLESPDWHGRNLNALRDSVVTGGINGIEPPYVFRNINISFGPEELKNFKLAVFEILIDSAVLHSDSRVIFES